LVQWPQSTELPSEGVFRRFLGAEADQAHVAPNDETGDEMEHEASSEKSGHERLEQQAGNRTDDAHAVEDGQDEEGGEANSTSSEAMNVTELEIHYDKVFDQIEGAEFLPPWLLVPFLLLAKQMFTFLVFGFDMRFKPEDDPTGLWWYLTVLPKDFLRAIFQLFSCALVVNGYRSDWVEYQEAVAMLDAAIPENGISSLERVALFIEVISTSGNFTAAAIVFVATLEQKHASGTPTYFSLPAGLDTFVLAPFRFSVFPWIPCSAHWMPTVKHLYMYLLLPYTILPLVCNKLFGVVTTLLHFCVIVKVTYGFMFCLPLTLLTLTLVPYFYDCTAEFAAKLAPLWLLAFLKIEGAICVALVGLAWVLFKCKMDKMQHFVQITGLVYLTSTPQGQAVNVLQGYAADQPDEVKKDFEHQAVSTEITKGDPITGELFVLMLVAYKSLDAIMFTQIAVLTCMRTLMTGHLFASYAEVMLGRSWEGYTTHLSTQMHEGVTSGWALWEHREEHMHDAAAAWEVVSKTLNALWTA